ncbi:aconitase X catalytic domain-containing protein [Tissierella carlieri]|uniref:Aconitase X catalytic domain-containing protein n=1 Tax=Tissierella carlieri TaxID=689904 RepID=A0ABT1S7J6_9FIRM|nr:aconitase X [Tissierella carlieri]MCQ4922439.1 aconitase X catalytic domain-containing protein [Tissierella carlieri]
MDSYNMKLTPEEIEILDGRRGETLQKALKSVVLYGETFGAERLLPIEGSIHLVTSFGIPMLTPVFDIMDELIKENLRTKKSFTVDPRPLDYENVKCNPLQKIVFRIMYGKQEMYEKQLKEVGLKDDNAFTCTCYLPEVGNMPKKGDILSWAESSAVVFANSVLGARSNRNSGVIELLCGIVGKVPEFGLLTDEGRKAKWLIQLKTSKLPNAQILGSAIGMKVMEDVPYIVGLDKHLGKGISDTTINYLKDMGAASASNGAVGLYHVENITPEAIDLGESLLVDDYKTYIIGDEELNRIYESYPVMWKNTSQTPKKCFIGCPHLSLGQVYDWVERIEEAVKISGKGKVLIDTILSASPDVIQEFKKDKLALQRLNGIGVKLTYICPLMYMNNPLCAKEPIITNSNKLRTYTTARFYTDETILSKITGLK